MPATRHRILALAGFLLVVGIVCWLLHDAVTLSQVVRQEQQLRATIDEHGFVAFAAGFALYVLVSLIPGTPGKAVVFGWLYGFWQALVIVDCALTIAAVATFLLSRYVFLEIVEARTKGLHRRLNAALARDGPFYLLTLRLMHAPYTLMNYACGAAGVRTRTFWWTTQIGILPGTIACVFVGSRLPSLARLHEQGFWSLFDPVLLAALVLTALLPLAVRFALRS
jgi:uncharacterized membrane protein YdjX (TVP38/TMEM64 family)